MARVVPKVREVALPPRISGANSPAVPVAMQGFVEALGLLYKGTCRFCHVDDRSPDEKTAPLQSRLGIECLRKGIHAPPRPEGSGSLNLRAYGRITLRLTDGLLAVDFP